MPLELTPEQVAAIPADGFLAALHEVADVAPPAAAPVPPTAAPTPPPAQATVTPAHVGIVTSALEASRARFKRVTGYRDGSAFAVVLDIRSAQDYTYLLVLADDARAEFVRVARDQRTVEHVYDPIVLSKQEQNA